MVNFSISNKQPPSRSRQKKELYKLVVARSDITASLDACNLILQNVKSIKDPTFYPLTTAVVVCYSRPFTANKPYGAISKKLAKFKNPQYNKVHKKILEARHNLFAHSNMYVREVRIVPPNTSCMVDVDNVQTNLKSTEILTEVKSSWFKIEFFEIVKEVNINLGCRIQSKIDKLIDSLYSGMDLPNKEFPLTIDDKGL